MHVNVFPIKLSSILYRISAPHNKKFIQA